MLETKIYIVWLNDPHEYGGRDYIHKIFKSKISAETFCNQKNEKEMDSYSYWVEEEELYE